LRDGYSHRGPDSRGGSAPLRTDCGRVGANLYREIRKGGYKSQSQRPAPRCCRDLGSSRPLPNGPALSCEPQRLRGSPEAPELQCQRLPKVDWNALWLVSCSALLGGMPRARNRG
jgi:hypothetical protein